MKKLLISLISASLGLSAFAAGNSAPNSAPIPASSTGGQTQAAISVTPITGSQITSIVQNSIDNGSIQIQSQSNSPAGSACGSGRRNGFYGNQYTPITPCNGQPIYIQGMGNIYHPPTPIWAGGGTVCGSSSCGAAPVYISGYTAAYYLYEYGTIPNCPAGYAVGDFLMDNDQSNAAMITSCLKQ